MIKSILFSLILVLFGCAVGMSAGTLRLQDRELLIHPDRPGLGYPHNVSVCVDRKKPWRWILGKKKCRDKHVVDFYDLNKKSDRDKLIHAGFTCKSPMRFRN